MNRHGNSPICCAQVTKADLAPNDAQGTRAITGSHIAEAILPIGSAIAATDIAEEIFASDGAAARFPDVTEYVFTQGVMAAIVH